jgi:hypothetical protein
MIFMQDKIKKKKKKKDNSKNGDMFLNCRSCKTIITNDYRSRLDTRDIALIVCRKDKR